MPEPQTATTSISDWFVRRSYTHDQFSDLTALAERKRELGLSLSVVLPARKVASTVGPIVEKILGLNEFGSMVDQLIVVDADSDDGTAAVASRAGAKVYAENDLLPEFGPVIGKGDAMWRALTVASGDLVAYLDADTTDFSSVFVSGLLGPLLVDPELQFVKAAYSRPFKAPDGTVLDDAGRVTELTAKPLFNAHCPELSGFGQPLSGELIARRELLCSIPFLTGYAVETAMLIDVFEQVGLDRMGQSWLGTRHNRYQSLFDLSAMAYAVVRAVLARAGVPDHLTPQVGDPDRYLHAFCPPEGVQLSERLVPIVERPPIGELA